MSILNVEPLTHGFGDRAIFHDVSFRLLKGEHIGLVGANGEGKSTFMNIITGHLAPDEGKVEWAKNVRVGYLDQHTVLSPGMTVRGVLSSAFDYLYEMERQMNEICDKMGEATEEELEDYVPDFTIYVAPGFLCIPELDGTNSEAAIIIDYEAHEVVIAGSQYAGEIKKSVFSVMNYVLPKEGILSMHCSANVGPNGDSAVFFGLSGTGKTTLSADPARFLIGDDEHGWSDDGVFNIEGGCYAKCINLSAEHEPEIYGAIKFGSLMENVILNEKGEPDYDDGSLTENTRVGYPVHYIPNAVIPGVMNRVAFVPS